MTKLNNSKLTLNINSKLTLNIISDLTIFPKKVAEPLGLPSGIICFAIVDEKLRTVVGPFDEILLEKVITVDAYYKDSYIILGTPPTIESGQLRVDYQPIDAICNLILTIAWESEYSNVTKLGLNKILYYLQAAFITTYNQPLFRESFSKGSYGPYCGVVNKEFFDCGAARIPKDRRWVHITYSKTPKNQIDIDTLKFDKRTVSLQNEPMEFLVKSIKQLLTISPWELVEKSRAQSISEVDDTLALTFSKFPDGIVTDYNDKEFKNYFESHPEEWLWLPNPNQND